MVLLQVDVGLCKLLVIRNTLVKDFSGKVKFLIEAAVTANFVVGLVRFTHEALKVSEPSFTTLSVGKDQLVIHTLVFHERSCHQKVLDKLFRLILLPAEFNYSLKLTGIVGFDEGIDGGRDATLVELGFSKLGPNFRLVSFLGKLSCLSDVVKFVENYLDGVDWLVELFVDAECFLIQAVLWFESHSGKLVTIVVIQSVNVVHHT